MGKGPLKNSPFKAIGSAVCEGELSDVDDCTICQRGAVRAEQRYPTDASP